MTFQGPNEGCSNATERKDSEGGTVLLVAAVAMIDADDRILMTKRPEGKHLAGTWEFPGGKVREGETPEAALVREVQEELGVDIAESCLAPFTFASHAYDDFHLPMPLYLCRIWRGLSKAGKARPEWARVADMPDLPCRPRTNLLWP